MRPNVPTSTGVIVNRPESTAARSAARQERLERLNASLERAAATDPLTGLPNRRRFAAQQDLEWHRCAEYGQPLSILLIDVDAFKADNDMYGPAQGDRSLQAIAKAIAAAVGRPADFCARDGGEKFVVLLANTDRDAATVIAERIRGRVLALQISHAGSTAGVCHR